MFVGTNGESFVDWISGLLMAVLGTWVTVFGTFWLVHSSPGAILAKGCRLLPAARPAKSWQTGRRCTLASFRRAKES